MKSLASSQSPRDKEVTKVERPPNSVNHRERKERALLEVNEFRNWKRISHFFFRNLARETETTPTPPAVCMNVKTRDLRNLHFISD